MNSKEHMDLSILKLKQLYNKNESTFDIRTGTFFIQGKPTTFEPSTLFDDTVELLLPSTFIPMPKEIVSQKYLSATPPSTIFTTEDYNVDLSFHLLKNDGRPLWELTEVMKSSILRNAPETVFYDEENVPHSTLLCRWFDYKSFALRDELYNSTFLLSSTQHVLVGCFNCELTVYDEWGKYILALIHQITIKDSLGGKPCENTQFR